MEGEFLVLVVFVDDVVGLQVRCWPGGLLSWSWWGEAGRGSLGDTFVFRRTQRRMSWWLRDGESNRGVEWMVRYISISNILWGESFMVK